MRALPIVGAAASVILLAGCAAPIVTPAPADDRDLVLTQQRILDATYDREGFDSERLITVDISGLPENSYDGFGACLAEGGYDTSIGWGSSIGPDGFSLNGINDAEVTKDDQFLAYTCLAKHPYDLSGSGMVYSEAQRNYLWDYYARWVTPCLRSHRFVLLSIPSKDEFLNEFLYPWSPYDALDYTTAGGLAGFEKLQQQCGPRLGILGQ